MWAGTDCDIVPKKKLNNFILKTRNEIEGHDWEKSSIKKYTL